MVRGEHDFCHPDSNKCHRKGRSGSIQRWRGIIRYFSRDKLDQCEEREHHPWGQGSTSHQNGPLSMPTLTVFKGGSSEHPLMPKTATADLSTASKQRERAS